MGDKIVESETPLEFQNLHTLDQIENEGFFLNDPESGARKLIIQDGVREPLWLSVTVTRINKLSVKEESYEITFGAFFFWRVNLQESGLLHLSEKADMSPSLFYRLNSAEMEEFAAKQQIPHLRVMNAIHVEPENDEEIRVFRGSNECNYILFRNNFICTVHCVFRLENFPYDVQNLPLKFGIKKFELWKKYNLTVLSVSLFKHSLEMSEWFSCEPSVKRSSPKESQSYIFFRLKRHSAFYVQHVVLLMFALEFLGLVTFACDPSEIGAPLRATIIVTLLLTMVALKFAVSGSLPSVPYSTPLDNYFQISFGGLSFMTFLTIIPQFWHHEEEQITANATVGGFSFAMTLVGLLYWYVVTQRQVTRQDRNVKRIAIIPNAKNYYTFRFADAPFHKGSSSSKKVL
jgi:hypothetical protein